jgi:inosose dehydratase
VNNIQHRRDFLKTIAAGAAGSLVAGSVAGSLKAHAAAATRHLKIGFTCITWGTFPRPTPDVTLEAALKDIANLGFWGFETFGETLIDWDSRRALQALIDRYGVPLKSGYSGTNLTDSTMRADSIAKVVEMGKAIKKYGGTFGVLAPNGVHRDSYDFKMYRDGIVSSLNDHAKALNDLGLGAGLHQHTGTCIETRDEVYAVMDAVDTKHMKFAPDVGQLQKGGADAAKVIKDYLPLVEHMHLKDFVGGKPWGGYCPLGMGKVDIPAILDMLEAGGNKLDVMIEQDPSADQPISPTQSAEISKVYLQKLGYTFRS